MNRPVNALNAPDAGCEIANLCLEKQVLKDIAAGNL